MLFKLISRQNLLNINANYFLGDSISFFVNYHIGSKIVRKLMVEPFYHVVNDC